MAEVSVCAVVADAAAVGQQQRPPEFVEVVGADGIAGAVGRAAATGATWLWLLDDSVTPAPGALQALIESVAHSRELGDPILMTSMVVTPDGELDLSAAPWPRLFWRENAIQGAEHRLVAVRAVCWGSMIVHRRALDVHGPPRPDFAGADDDLEWTGRLLRDAPGYLVPGSSAVRPAAVAADATARTRSRVRILRGQAWAGTDRVWFAFRLLRGGLVATLAKPASLPRLLWAAVAGLWARA
ncbi:MAG: hypothetical protein WKF96_01825 [Solirubrobacteraceae bacterium]